MTWRLAIQQASSDDAVMLRLSGRLGSAGSGTLIEAVNDAVRAGHRQFRLDLTDVDYASSAGLMSLDAVSGLIAGAGGTLVLAGLAPPVRLALELAGLLPSFTIDDNSTS